jgi:hypothetical protein
MDSDDLGTHVVSIGERLVVASVKLVHEGGMVEFSNPVTGEVVGSAGIRWWDEKKHHVPYRGPFPQMPDKDRWI